MPQPITMKKHPPRFSCNYPKYSPYSPCWEYRQRIGLCCFGTVCQSDHGIQPVSLQGDARTRSLRSNLRRHQWLGCSELSGKRLVSRALLNAQGGLSAHRCDLSSDRKRADLRVPSTIACLPPNPMPTSRISFRVNQGRRRTSSCPSTKTAPIRLEEQCLNSAPRLTPRILQPVRCHGQTPAVKKPVKPPAPPARANPFIPLQKKLCAALHSDFLKSAQ